MKSRLNILWTIAITIVTATAVVYSETARPPQVPQVKLLRTPQGGIQPQTAVDSRGVLHMIYFTGDAAAGNIEYVHRAPGAKAFSKPIRVNSQPGSALAVGTVRGPQMAVGPDGQVDVVWFGSSNAKPRGPGGSTPLLFSRLDASGTAFTPQRNLVRYAKGLDGGLSVAADRNGRRLRGVARHGQDSRRSQPARLPGAFHRQRPDVCARGCGFACRAGRLRLLRHARLC